MFDPKRYLDVVKSFAALATSDQPDTVKQLTGGLDMANKAELAKAEEMLLALFRYVFHENAPDWRVFMAPSELAEVPKLGIYFALVPASRAPDEVVTNLDEWLSDMRLFRFAYHTSNEQNCSYVSAVDQDMWRRRVTSRKAEAENRAFDEPCQLYMWRLAQAAYNILVRHRADRRDQSSLHVRRHMEDFRQALENDDRYDADVLAQAEGLDAAMRCMVFAAIALDMKPSKLLAEAEKQIEGIFE